MPMKTGTPAGGIRTVEDVRQRCRIDDITGCWEWALTINSRGVPVAWFPAERRNVTVPRIVLTLERGQLGAGRDVYRVCNNLRCVCPDHLGAGTRSQVMRNVGYRPTPEAVAKMVAAKRAKSPVNDDQRREIQASTQPLRVLAERYGISMSYASEIRRGSVGRLSAAPSVWEWRP